MYVYLGVGADIVFCQLNEDGLARGLFRSSAWNPETLVLVACILNKEHNKLCIEVNPISFVLSLWLKSDRERVAAEGRDGGTSLRVMPVNVDFTSSILLELNLD